MLGDITTATDIYIICGLSSAYFYPQLLLFSLLFQHFLQKKIRIKISLREFIISHNDQLRERWVIHRLQKERWRFKKN